MKTFKDIKTVLEESTCQKRKTICEIYSKQGDLLSRESNRCDPEGGICHRLGVVQSKENYDKSSNCNWTHAEMNAISNLPKDLKVWEKPYRAILFGHDFYCDKCEDALKLVGVKIFEIQNGVLNRIVIGERSVARDDDSSNSADKIKKDNYEYERGNE